MEYKDLLEVIGAKLADSELGYCQQNSPGFPQFNNKSGLEYYDWEQKTATPKLESLGYTNVRFSNGEADSFGPLTRIVEATKDGKRTYFIYG